MIRKTLVGLAACMSMVGTYAATDYPSGYTKCVQNTGATCTFSGTRSVALGKAGSFVYKTFTSSAVCSSSNFPANSFGTSAWCSYAGSTTSSSASSVPASSSSSRASSTPASSSSSRPSSSSSSRSSSVASSAASSTAGGQGSGHWNIQGNVLAHDPTITKEGSTWWVMHTGPGIQVKYSNDGINWTNTPQIFLSRPSWWKTYVPNHTNLEVWAPDLETYNGRVWLYYSISTFGSQQSAIGLASATSISSGAWRDDGMVIRSTSSNGYNAIDPQLTIDASGNPWLVFGSFWDGLHITKLDKSTMKPTGSITRIATRSGGIEAPTIVYRNGYYYLFASIDKCCSGTSSTYKIVYGRSTSINGTYKDKSGKEMRSGGGTVLDAGNARWIGPGHQDVYGGNVIARHAYDATDNGTAKLLISDLKWDSSGWPTY